MGVLICQSCCRKGSPRGKFEEKHTEGSEVSNVNDDSLPMQGTSLNSGLAHLLHLRYAAVLLRNAHAKHHRVQMADQAALPVIVL